MGETGARGAPRTRSSRRSSTTVEPKIQAVGLVLGDAEALPGVVDDEGNFGAVGDGVEVATADGQDVLAVGLGQGGADSDVAAVVDLVDEVLDLIAADAIHAARYEMIRRLHRPRLGRWHRLEHRAGPTCAPVLRAVV